jgi:hypothetical protein
VERVSWRSTRSAILGPETRLSSTRLGNDQRPRIRFCLMRYSLHEIDKHQVVATTVAADRDEALESFSGKLRLMLSFEGDPAAAEYILDEWPDSLPYLAHTPKPIIPVFVVRAVAAHPQASQGAGCGQTGA